MANSSMSKSKKNQNMSYENSPAIITAQQQQSIKDSHFQGRNMGSMTRSSKRKHTPGWGQDQSMRNTNFTQMTPAIRNSNTKKIGNNSTMDLGSLENWKNDFILSSDKNI